MKLISSKTTFFHKRLFPLFWFGFSAFEEFDNLFFYSRARKSIPLDFLLAPIVAAIIGYLFMKKRIFTLMDEVWDAGDVLIVRNKNQEEQIPLSEIMNVSYSFFRTPQRITLTIKNPCRWGTEVSFVPSGSFNPFKKSPLILDLIKRLDAKRKG